MPSPQATIAIATSAIAGSIAPLTTTGRIFYVDSTHSNASDKTYTTGGYGLNPNYPFATLDFAIGQCTANKGDIIILAPGHAESIATAGGVTCDVAGITIIGQGNGSNRPTFSFSATDSTLLVSAANVTIRNIVTIPSIDEVVSAINVTAAGCTLDAVDVRTVSSKQFIQWLLTSAAADNLTIKNCCHWQPVAANSAQVWIELVAGANAMIVDNDIDILANASASSICIRASTASTNTRISRNLICYRGASVVSVISLITTSTGFINDNRIGMTSTSGTIDNIITGDTAFKFNNLVMDVAGTASGLLAPAVGTLT